MSDSIQLAYHRLDLRTARQRIADLERDLAAAVAEFETGLTIIKERDATIAKLREELERVADIVCAEDRQSIEAFLAATPESKPLAECDAQAALCAKLRGALQISHDCWHAMRKHNAAAQFAAENCMDEVERRTIEEALRATPESAASEMAQLREEQMQYSVLRNTLAASLEIGVPERTRAGDNSLIDAITDLRDAARAAK